MNSRVTLNSSTLSFGNRRTLSKTSRIISVTLKTILRTMHYKLSYSRICALYLKLRDAPWFREVTMEWSDIKTRKQEALIVSLLESEMKNGWLQDNCSLIWSSVLIAIP
jgi:hypothetical protein